MISTPGILTLGGGETFETASLPDAIYTWKEWMVYTIVTAAAFLGGATPYPAANLAIYYPLYLPVPFTFDAFIAINNASVPAGNVDFGIYKASDFSKVISTGSVANAGSANQKVFYTVTPTTLPADGYYLGVSKNETTSSFPRHDFGSALSWNTFGVCWQALSFPLPSTMAPSRSNANNPHILNIGIRRFGALAA